MRQLSCGIFLVSWSWISYLKCLLSFNFTKHKGHGNLLTAFKKVLASFLSFLIPKKIVANWILRWRHKQSGCQAFSSPESQLAKPETSKSFLLGNSCSIPGRCKYVEILAKHWKGVTRGGRCRWKLWFAQTNNCLLKISMIYWVTHWQIGQIEGSKSLSLNFSSRSRAHIMTSLLKYRIERQD